MSERLTLNITTELSVSPQEEAAEYSIIVAEYNAANLGLSVEVSQRLLNYAKEEILKNPKAHGLVNDRFLFNQEATRIMLANLSKTMLSAQKKITGWGGSDKYLDDLLLYLTKETRKRV